MYDTFVHQFVDEMGKSPDELAMVCIDEDSSERLFTRGQFLRAVQYQASQLKSQGINLGDIVLLALPHGIELFSAFWGVLFLGGIPIIYTYPDPQKDQEIYCEQLKDFSLHVHNTAVLIPPEFFGDLQDLFAGSNTKLIQVNINDTKWDEAHIVPVKVPSLEETAILQFSSGTTGAKKGVMLSYRAIMNYLEANAISMRLTSSDVMASWLPLNHDMGLIACFIVPLINGFPTVIMSPQYWIAEPSSLFRLVHKYQVTITLMPNFAFNYCARTVTNDQLEGVDLSSWRLVINGAELVRKEDLGAFLDRFSPYGFSQPKLKVGYGMAECVLGVSRTSNNIQPRVDWIDQDALFKEDKAVVCEPDSPSAKAIVSCGRSHPMVDILIVDDAGHSLAERRVGEIKIQSTTLFSGYHLQPEMTNDALVDGWFYTGDLGYLSEGELYVCGRKKDSIITYGRMIYPTDIEGIAESFLQVRKGRTVAFGVADKRAGTDKVVLVCELTKHMEQNERTQLIDNVRSEIWQRLDITISEIQVVDKGWVIKTTSGKIARSANKEKYLKKRHLS